MKNLPEDWSNFYKTCSKCRYRFHASEHACPECIRAFENQNTKDTLRSILNPKRND